MSSGSFWFLVSECWFNLRRNVLMTLAALVTVTVTLTVLGAALWTARRISEYADQQPQAFNRIDAFLYDSVKPPARKKLIERLSSMPRVSRVKLVTREKAWADLQAGEPGVAGAVQGNPLPDKLEIEARTPADLPGVARALRIQADWPQIEHVNDAGQEVRTMLGIARLIRYIGFASSIGLLAATFLIIHNTIRLTVWARRREIRIMQLVGASAAFIRFPLVLEGLLLGVTGGLVASIIVLICGHQVSSFVASIQSPLITDLPTSLTPLRVGFGIVGLGGIIGVVGAWFSSRHFLRAA